MHTNPDITTDLFLGGKLKIHQFKKGFRSGSDAVFLSAFVPSLSGKILEIGCGAGVASLCLGYRAQDAHITGIDSEDSLIGLAQENAKINGLADRCTFMAQDIRHLTLPPQTFDHVFSNPPYFNDSSPSPCPQKALARTQSIPLAEWVGYCIKMAKPRGRVSFIFPTENLHHLLLSLKGLGDIHLVPLWPAPHEPSKRILVSARKGVKGGLHLSPGLILHTHAGGPYTPKAEGILRDGEGLPY